MAEGYIDVPHKPEFHDFTLPTGITAQPAGANNGYMVFPDGKVRVEINVAGVTPNQMTVLVSDFPVLLRPTKAGSYAMGYIGSDGANIGSGYGIALQVINDGRVRVFSTSTFAISLWVEYYP